jgi:hypothetical protein
MATLTWDAAGGNPAPGQPAAFDALARRFSEIASDAADARGKLDRFGKGIDDNVWRGDTAGAFKEKIGELPPRLAKLHDSYATASGGMATYGRALRNLQEEAHRLLGQAQSAHDEKAGQERSRDQAQAADPAASTSVHEDAIDRARRRLDGARDRLDDLRDRRRAAENAAIDRLEDAHDQGIENDPWWKRAWDSIDRWVDEHADILKKISEVLKWVSAAAGLLSLIPGLGVIFGPIALLAGGAALLIDATLAATGNGTWKMLLLDAALMAVPGAGRLLARASRISRVAGKITDHTGLPKAVSKTIVRNWERGKRFNTTRGHSYRHNEVRLTNGKVLDSYKHHREIVSRKHTQLAEVKPNTAKGYINELPRKYSPGQVVADTTDNAVRSPELIGKQINGDLVLEVPKQKAPIPQEILDQAQKRNVLIREVSDFEGFPVGPPVSQVESGFAPADSSGSR